jgi:hypothetical protein
MKHLLLTRFQGALIGGNIIYINSQQIAINQLILDLTPSLFSGIDSLVRYGKFDRQDWIENIFTNPPSGDRAILAMLPSILFFHDDRVKLREILIDISHGWQLDWETCSSAVAIGYIISRSLTESLQPQTIIERLLDETINLHPLLFQGLSTLDRLIDGSYSLHRVIQKLSISSHPIVRSTLIAIYCFLSTPEDLSLSLRRAYRIDDSSHLICAIAGMLSGAHNSLIGIPLNGYLATQERDQWLSSAAKLLDAWAGIDRDRSSMNSISSELATYPLAVAAPQVIQRRDRSGA